MLNDIVKITEVIFDKFIKDNKSINSSKNIYDVFRTLEDVIYNTDLVANHYLALDFTETYLQDSSGGGSPQDKWRKFLNEDLDSLNKSIKKYLFSLQYVSLKDYNICTGGFLSEIYKSKVFYSVVRDQYSVGFIEPCSMTLIKNCLKINIQNSETFYINELESIDLSKYE